MEDAETIGDKIHCWREVINWSIFLLTITVFTTVVRFVAKWRLWKEKSHYDFKWIGSDDALIIPSLLSIIVVGVTWATCAQATIDGYGVEPNSDQARDAAVAAAKSEWTGSLFYSPACNFPKLSICALYLRVFATRRTRLITWGVTVFLTANLIAFFVAQIFYCNPPSYYWESYAIKDTARVHLDKSKCFNNYALVLATNPPNILSDMVLLILPLPTVWHMHTNRSRKIGLTITFGLGNIGMIGSIVRWCSYLTKMTNSSIKIQSYQLILTLLEPTMYHLAACLPPTRSLFTTLSDKIQSSKMYSALTTWTSSKVGRSRIPSASDIPHGRPHVVQQSELTKMEGTRPSVCYSVPTTAITCTSEFNESHNASCFSNVKAVEEGRVLALQQPDAIVPRTE